MISQILSGYEAVLGADQLPVNVLTVPCSFVINLDKSTQPGSHWVSIHIDVQRKAEYFDSYGFPPLNLEFVQFMRRNSKTWTYNAIGLQSIDSDVCGQYCAMYLYFRTRHYTLHDFISLFSKDRGNNDALVSYLYSKFFLGKAIKTLYDKINSKTPHVHALLSNLGFTRGHRDLGRNHYTANVAQSPLTFIACPNYNKKKNYIKLNGGWKKTF